MSVGRGHAARSTRAHRARGLTPAAHSPGADRGAHEHVVQHEEPALLGFHDLPPVVVDGLYHVVRADEVATAAA